MSEPLPLRKVIEKIHDGSIRIPGFQRGFVWDPNRAALLMDSIFKGYPIGSVLLWRTKSQLVTEKHVGGFELPKPEKDYPIDYVLDGQQRLTSIFSTFQTILDPPEEDPESWLPIYFDFEAKDDAQDPRFVALANSDVVTGRHFPLRTFFDPIEFNSEMLRLNSEDKMKEVVRVQQSFQEALVPAETFETEDRTKVAIVFERVNRMGVDLDMFELLTAWTWSEEFDLQEKFKKLAAEFDEFGFGDVGSNNDLMLRCTAAILKEDPSPTSLINVNGGEVRDKFDVVAESLRLAIDFLRRNLKVRHVKMLPYSAQLIPLASYFSVKQTLPIPAGDREVLLRWFWRSTFGHRYSGNPTGNIKQDVEAAMGLRRGGAGRALDDITISIDQSFFTSRTFNVRTVATKATILLLASANPLTFISGQSVDFDKVMSEPNRNEFYHLMPRKWMRVNHPTTPTSLVDSLANFAILGRSENNKISAKAPSEYHDLLDTSQKAEIEKRAMIPSSLWDDNPSKFFNERAAMMAAAATEHIS